MVDLVVPMNKSKNKNINNVIEKVSNTTSKKFAFLTGGSKVRNYEAVIGVHNKRFKITIDSEGELEITKFENDSKSRTETRNPRNQ